MKKIFSCLILLFLVSHVVVGQLTSISVSDIQQNSSSGTRKIDIYDGSCNCPYENYHLLVGQEIHVLPLPKEATIYNQNRNNGYKGFKTMKFNVNKDKWDSKRYGNPAIGDKKNTVAEDIENKTFIIKSIDDNGEEYPTYTLLLEEKNNPQNECQYTFRYRDEFNLTFITAKHLQYLKDSCIGKTYYFDKYCLYKYDINTGVELQNIDKHPWICKDIIVSPESGKITMLVSSQDDETYVQEYAGAMRHSTSSSVVESISLKYGEARADLSGYKMAFSNNAWIRLVEEYGEDMMWAVLQHRVIKGMPITLVKRALGYSPESSYNTSSGSVVTYETLEHVTKIKNPLPVYQNGRIKISIYFDANNEVIGWSD